MSVGKFNFEFYIKHWKTVSGLVRSCACNSVIRGGDVKPFATRSPLLAVLILL